MIATVRKLNKLKNLYLSGYRGLPFLAWEGIAINFLQTMLTGVFYYLTYYFVHVLNYSAETAGLFISCYGIGAIFGGYIGGKASDCFPAKTVCAIALLIEAITFLAFIEIKANFSIVINTFFLGSAAYGFISANYAYILDQCRESEPTKLRAINIIAVASNLALGMAAVVVSFFSNYGFKYLFGVNFLALTGISIYLLVTGNNTHFVKDTISEHEVNQYLSKRSICKLSITLICVFLAGLIVSQMSTTYSLYIQSVFPEYGLNGFSLLFMLNTTLVMLLQSPLGEYVSNYNRMVIVGFGSFLLGLGMLVLGFSIIYPMAILASIVYTFGEMIFFSVAQLVCYENAPMEKKGQFLGIYRTIYAASRVVGPLLGGIIYYRVGGACLWYICAFVGMISFLPCLYYRDEH